MMLNESQLQVVHSTSPITVAAAGPGAGKTRTLAATIQNSLHREPNSHPLRRVVITYTTAAAKEIASRLRGHWGGERLTYCGTLHGYCLKLLQQHGSELGYRTGAIEVLDPAKSKAAYEDAMTRLGYRVSAKALQADFTYHAKQVNREYRACLKRANVIDYDEILRAGLELHQRTALYDALRVDELLIDEAQDSAGIDWDIYDAIAAGQKWFFADVDQSIYSWRGATPERLLAMATSPHVLTVKMQSNYRSGSTICEAANRLIAHNLSRLETWTMSERPDIEDSISYSAYLSAHHEIMVTAKFIQEALDEGVPPSEIAVLARYNKLAIEMRQGLASAGIPLRPATRRDLIDGTNIADATDDESEHQDGVYCGTVHGFKGREADTVFVVGMEEGQLPSGQDLEESRRLAFVAVTRAKRRLYLSSVATRFLHGRQQDQQPSRFLTEMGVVS